MAMVFPFLLYSFPGMILSMDKLEVHCENVAPEEKTFKGQISNSCTFKLAMEELPESSLRIPSTIGYVSRGITFPLLVWKC